MLNPIAQSFMIATRSRNSAFWEEDSFGNLRDRGATPRLVAAPKAGARRRFSLFRRRATVTPADL